MVHERTSNGTGDSNTEKPCFIPTVSSNGDVLPTTTNTTSGPIGGDTGSADDEQSANCPPDTPKSSGIKKGSWVSVIGTYWQVYSLAIVIHNVAIMNICSCESELSQTSVLIRKIFNRSPLYFQLRSSFDRAFRRRGSQSSLAGDVCSMGSQTKLPRPTPISSWNSPIHQSSNSESSRTTNITK